VTKHKNPDGVTRGVRCSVLLNGCYGAGTPSRRGTMYLPVR
jgi:hypothetical protein